MARAQLARLPGRLACLPGRPDGTPRTEESQKGSSSQVGRWECESFPCVGDPSLCRYQRCRSSTDLCFSSQDLMITASTN
eukprot:scaffold447_cov307-Pinguiococcus_pyrenoidosus.AAC.55